MESDTVLVIGAGGQIGSELVLALEKKYGKQRVLASDLNESPSGTIRNSNYVQLDALDEKKLREVVAQHNVTEIYLLAALLSATAEKNPEFAWKLNMESLFHVLNLGKEGVIKKIFWPSSIAVFGPTTPRDNTPQFTVMEPSTVYGISKQAGEQWCAYYYNKFGVDVRSIRYPGLISYTSLPGGGTTDYAVDIFYAALKNREFNCFLKENTALPMMYMEDAIRATLELMDAPKDNLSVRTSYNISGVSFTPKELSEAIKTRISDFGIKYAPDFRQLIADSWPKSIDDSQAAQDWGWKAEYNIKKLVDTMLDNVNPDLMP
jgi:nucleoside-diphosphate-sugar epimerase